MDSCSNTTNNDGVIDGGAGGGGGNQCCMARFVDKGTVESSRLHLGRRTVLEMLRDRGYVVSESEITLSLSDFRQVFGLKPDLERLRICVPLRSNPSKKVLVIFCGTAEIRKAVIIGIFSQIVNKEGLHRVILILQSKINSHAWKIVAGYPIKVETFRITDLLVNITKHVLQPKYEILTAVEKTAMLKKFCMEEKQMPRMLENDAIVRYYGLEKGQVVKVTYSGLLTDHIVNYRCVM